MICKCATTVLVAAASMIVAGAANADSAVYHVANTGGLGLIERSGPDRNSDQVGWLGEGQQISIVCQTGDEVNNTSNIWDQCEKAVDDAYGTHRHAIALDGWEDAIARGVAHPGDQNPPRGALVYWNIPNYANGHVGIALGDGTVVATSVNDAIGAAHLPFYPGYLGWAPPNFG